MKVVCCLCLLLITAVAGCTEAKSPPPARRDFYGDPLPNHALARLGSVRFRPRASVWAMDISPDGKLVATGTIPGSVDNEVELWNPTDGMKVGSLLADRDTNNILSLTFSPDGKRLAVSHGCRVEIFDVKTSTSLCEFDRQTDRRGFWSLRWSPDGKLLAAARPSERPAVWLWDASTGRRLYIIEHPSKRKLDAFEGQCVAFSPDSKRLAATAKAALLIFDTKTMNTVQTLDLTGSLVRSVAYSADGKLIATSVGPLPGRVASDDEAGAVRVILWNTSGEVQREITCDRQGRVSFTSDSKMLLLSGFSGPVSAWDVATGELRYTIDRRGFVGRPLSLSADGRMLATADQRIGLWNPATGESLYSHNTHGSSVFTACFSPDGKTVLTGSGDGTVRAWQPDTGRPLKALELDSESPMGIHALAHNGMFVAAGADNGAAYVLDATALKLRGALRPKKVTFQTEQFFAMPSGNPANSLMFLPSGDLLSSLGTGALEVWDVAGLAHKRTLIEPTSPAISIVVSRNGKRAGVPTGQNIELWDLDPPRQRHVFAGVGLFSSPSAFSNDGSRLVTAVPNPRARRFEPGEAALVRLWDCETGEALWTAAKPISSPSVFAYSPDGKFIASSGLSDQNLVHLWSAADGTHLLKLEGHLDMVRDLDFSPDGKRLVSASQDTTPLVWDMTPALRKLR